MPDNAPQSLVNEWHAQHPTILCPQRHYLRITVQACVNYQRGNNTFGGEAPPECRSCPIAEANRLSCKAGPRKHGYNWAAKRAKTAKMAEERGFRTEAEFLNDLVGIHKTFAKAAKAIGVHRATLCERMRRYGIEGLESGRWPAIDFSSAAKKYGYETEEEMFTKLYAENSDQKIADMLGCNPWNVRKKRKDYGIASRINWVMRDQVALREETV